MIKQLYTRYKWHIIAIATFLTILLLFTLFTSNRSLNRKYKALEREQMANETTISVLKVQLRELSDINGQYDLLLKQKDSLLLTLDYELQTNNKRKNEKISKVPSMSNDAMQRWFDERYPRSGN